MLDQKIRRIVNLVLKSQSLLPSTWTKSNQVCLIEITMCSSLSINTIKISLRYESFWGIPLWVVTTLDVFPSFSFWCAVHFCFKHLMAYSDSVFAETSVRSPRKVFMLTIKNDIYRIKVSQYYVIWPEDIVTDGPLQRSCCWRESFLGFSSSASGWIYTVYIQYISRTYSLYIYNYIQIYRAARNDKGPPVNNYASTRWPPRWRDLVSSDMLLWSPQKSFIYSTKLIFIYDQSAPNQSWCIFENKTTAQMALSNVDSFWGSQIIQLDKKKCTHLKTHA